MNVSLEKVQAAIKALHAAETALLALDTVENCVIAGECAVAAVYLETSLAIAGAPVTHYRAVGEVR